MKCPKCGCSGGLNDLYTDLIAMVVDVECADCHCEFKLRIDDEAFDINTEAECEEEAAEE